MIIIRQKEDCCGCTACVQACPKHCIGMKVDEQGFSYPEVNADLCIGCNICEKVCPVISPFESKDAPISCYLCKTTDEQTRSDSSSGGIFTEIASEIIRQGGVVFGAQFNDQWQVEYSYTEDVKGLAPFRGSKYVQADIRGCYIKVRQFLDDGRKVLFTGTPCFVAGLKHYLRKDYNGLLTMDFVCHSIPSPLVWKLYLDHVENKMQSSIRRVSFRDKSNGWSNYSLAIESESNKMIETHFDNLYMQGFSFDLYTRPSCSSCPARNYKSGSDITLADAWDINRYHPELNDEKGISHVLVNTENGSSILELISKRIDINRISYEEVEPTSMHLPLTASCKPNKFRSYFYRNLQNTKNVSKLIRTSLVLDKLYRISIKIVCKIRGKHE